MKNRVAIVFSILRWLVIGLAPAAMAGGALAPMLIPNFSRLPVTLLKDVLTLLGTVALFGLYLAFFMVPPVSWWARTWQHKNKRLLHVVGFLFCIAFATQSVRFFVLWASW